jgi:cell division protein FtsQ
MGFVKRDREDMLMKTPSVKVETTEDMVFLNDDDIISRLKNMHLLWEGQSFKEMDIDKIEYALLNMPEISKAKVFFQLNGEWEIQCKLRVPVARVIDKEGKSFYIDENQKIMPISRKFSARVIPVTGEFYKSDFAPVNYLIHNEALINKNILDQVYRITNYVCNDELLSALITQIHYNENGDYELITLLGDQRVVFGKAENIEEKMEKLKVFYEFGISKTGWDLYKEIDIQYKDQIVCTKK